MAVLGVLPGGTPPSVSLASNKSLVTSTGSITLTATASSSVVKVEFYEGFTLLGTDTSAPFTRGITYSASQDTPHYYWARAYDGANNCADADVIAMEVQFDATPPTVVLLASHLTVTPPAFVNLVAGAQDAEGIAKVEFFRSSGFGMPTKLGEDAVPPYLHVVGFGTPGVSRYYARATDTSGNATSSARVKITVVAPTTTSTTTLTTTTVTTTSTTTASTTTTLVSGVDLVPTAYTASSPTSRAAARPRGRQLRRHRAGR